MICSDREHNVGIANLQVLTKAAHPDWPSCVSPAAAFP